MDQDKDFTYEELEEEEENYITLEFDDGETMECEILGIFEADGQEYMALAADDESGEVYLFRYREVDEEEFEILDIDDEGEFEKVSRVFQQIMEEENETGLN